MLRWPLRRCRLAGRLALPAVRAQDSIYVPLFTYRTGPFAGSGTPIADGMHDYLQHAERARRRHRRRQARHRGMRDWLRHQERRRVLRGGEGEKPGRGQSVVDRHHAAAHPARLRRQDPDPVHGLRPFRLGRRRRLPVGVQPAGHLLGRPVDDRQIHRRQGGRARQAQGQEDRLPPSRRRLRQGADPAVRGSWRRISASS